MRLIGMLDSPYVRRAAISFDFLAVPFVHESVSVFSTFEQFRTINPVVKAPSLVCANGDVIMDSSLILQYVEAALTDGDSLWSRDPATLQREMRAVSLALAACDKSVQIVYERNLRPTAAQYEPWMDRVRGQMLAAYTALNAELGAHADVYALPRSQACITIAVVWQFTQSMLAALVPTSDFQNIEELSVRMEATPQFLKYPPAGPGV